MLSLIRKTWRKKMTHQVNNSKSKEKEKQRIPTTEVSKHRGKEPTIISLAYAILRKDSIAVEKMLRVAKENGIL
ncbi:WD_0033/WD_0034 family tandem repeat-containing protein, partial [Wolbachia endosymbiont of Nomada leucophthalma]